MRLGTKNKNGWILKSITKASVFPSTTNLRHLSKAILVTSRKPVKNKYKDMSIAGKKEWR